MPHAGRLLRPGGPKPRTRKWRAVSRAAVKDERTAVAAPEASGQRHPPSFKVGRCTGILGVASPVRWKLQQTPTRRPNKPQQEGTLFESIPLNTSSYSPSPCKTPLFKTGHCFPQRIPKQLTPTPAQTAARPNGRRSRLQRLALSDDDHAPEVAQRLQAGRGGRGRGRGGVPVAVEKGMQGPGAKQMAWHGQLPETIGIGFCR